MNNTIISWDNIVQGIIFNGTLLQNYPLKKIFEIVAKTGQICTLYEYFQGCDTMWYREVPYVTGKQVNEGILQGTEVDMNNEADMNNVDDNSIFVWRDELQRLDRWEGFNVLIGGRILILPKRDDKLALKTFYDIYDELSKQPDKEYNDNCDHFTHEDYINLRDCLSKVAFVLDGD